MSFGFPEGIFYLINCLEFILVLLMKANGTVLAQTYILMQDKNKLYLYIRTLLVGQIIFQVSATLK